MDYSYDPLIPVNTVNTGIMFGLCCHFVTSVCLVVVCGGAYGQETPSPHWSDGNGRFSSFSNRGHGIVGKCLWSPLLKAGLLN